MKGAPGSSLTLDFREPLDPPSGGAVPLNFGVRLQTPIGVGALYATKFGSAGVALKSQFVRPLGWSDSSFPTWPLKTPTIEIISLKIGALGWQDGAIDPPAYVRWRRFVAPLGFSIGENIPAPYRVELAGGYRPAPGSNIILNFAENLAAPPGGAMVLEFGASAQTRVLGVTLGDASAFGQQRLTQPYQVRVTGLGPDSSVGIPHIEGNVRPISLSIGIGPPDGQVGQPELTKKAVALLPTGFAATMLGAPSIFNWTQYTRLGGFETGLYGAAFVQGGVKQVQPTGLAALALGATTVINTTANQSARPTGIAAPTLSIPSVSPQIIWALGATGWGVGIAGVNRNPSPSGFDGALVGVPAIEYKTRRLLIGAVGPVELGYPVVADPSRKVFPLPVAEAGLFGDIGIANKSARVLVQGVGCAELSPWTRVESTRRNLLAQGFDANELGIANPANKTPSIAPSGFNALSTPSSTETGVGYLVRYVRPSGMVAPGQGAPTLTKTPSIAPNGFVGDMGLPTVWPRVRSIGAVGLNAQDFGQHNTWFRYRYVRLSGSAFSSYGNPAVEHGNRILAASGVAQSAYGSPDVSMRNRTVEPLGIFPSFATAHMVGGRRFLRPMGYDAAQFGTRVIPEIQQVYPLGLYGSFGLATANNKTQQVSVAGFITLGQQPAERMGTAKVHNLVQYVSLYPDPDSQLTPPAWPQWMLVENRNRGVGTYGALASVVPVPAIENKARQVLPNAIAAPALPVWQQAAMVAYRVRLLGLDGLEAPHISSWANVRNSAVVLDAAGEDAKAFGRAQVENRSRKIDYIGGFDSAWCGYAFIAPRVRQIGFESRYSIEPPRIDLPNVRLHTRYVEPVAIAPKPVGGAAVEIHWTLITPRWTLQNLYGSPTVRNLTPEVPTHGYAMDEWGNAQVRLQWRPLAPEGTGMELFGKASIAERKQFIFTSGSNYLRFGDKLAVMKTGTPPYSVQSIWLDSGFGIAPPEDELTKSQLGTPSLKQNIIYVHEDKAQTKMGEPLVTANSIRVEPGYSELLVGDPSVSLRNRRIFPKEIPETAQVAAPRLSPHTVYAVYDAPAQAKMNHPTVELHYVDEKKPGGVGAVLGTPNVQNQHRRLYPSAHYGGGVGAASVMSSINYLLASGFNSLRFGWHSLPCVQQVEFYTETSTMEFGSPTVKRPPYMGAITISPIGLNASTTVNPRVDLKTRVMRPIGFDSSALGQSKQGDLPFMWQGLRVGPLVANTPEGFASEAFGQFAISLRVRQVSTEGFDAALSEYDYFDFDKRIRVSRGVIYEQALQILVDSTTHDDFGVPNARLAAHYIRPDGNSDQYRKGAPS